MKLFDPKPGLKARLARFVIRLDSWGTEHVGCKRSDHDHYDALYEGGDYCCGQCGCCPCWSIRCDWCRPKRLKYEDALDRLHGVGYVTSEDLRQAEGLTSAEDSGTL